MRKIVLAMPLILILSACGIDRPTPISLPYSALDASGIQMIFTSIELKAVQGQDHRFLVYQFMCTSPGDYRSVKAGATFTTETRNGNMTWTTTATVTTAPISQHCDAADTSFGRGNFDFGSVDHEETSRIRMDIEQTPSGGSGTISSWRSDLFSVDKDGNVYRGNPTFKATLPFRH